MRSRSDSPARALPWTHTDDGGHRAELIGAQDRGLPERAQRNHAKPDPLNTY
jgi:hypothetical protein